MGGGTEDKATYNRMTRTLPVQPARCKGVMTFYEQPNFQLFLQEVKKVIRTCVQEGRENELLDNNPSLLSAWNEMQQQPTSMNLQKGRRIEVVPQYDWEPTSGPPFWRTTRITFRVQRKKTPAPPIPQYQPPDVKQDPPKPPVPRPIDPCSRSTSDCKPKPPTLPGFEEWFYCSEAGVKSIVVKRGETPPPQADAKSGFYPTIFAARLECFKNQPDLIDPPPEKKPPEDKKPPKKAPQDKQPKAKQPQGKQPTTTESSSSSDLSQLEHLLPLFLLFGAVFFVGEGEFVMDSMFEVFELEKELKALSPGEYFFELETNRVKNTLSVNVIRNGVSQNLQTYIDNLMQSGTIGENEYDRLKDLADDVEVKMQQLEGRRSLRSARSFGKLVRGFYIEDTYIEKKLQAQGYVGLPDWFKGYDAYKQGARFSVKKTGGKYVTTFYNPDLISIKSYEPRNGLLRNVDLDYLDRQSDQWLGNMQGNVFEKGKVRIVLSSNPNNPMPPPKKEIHLVILSEDNASLFRQQIQGIQQLANRKGFTIKVIQYLDSTQTFKTLL